MTVDKLISLARTLTHTNSSQVTGIQALEFINIIYHKVAWAIISRVDEDFFWDTFTADTVANQNEYVMPLASATVAWMDKINRVEVKWASTDTYTTIVWADTLDSYKQRSDAKLQTDISTQDAWFDLRDGSLFLYPKPTNSITGGIKINWIVTLIDLLTGWAENTIFPNNSDLRDYHDVLAIWMKQYIFSLQGLSSEKNDSIQEFQLKLDELISHLKNRSLSSVERPLPNATSLIY